MAAADVNRNVALDDQLQLSKSRRKKYPRNSTICQWPTQKELFTRFWDLGPSKERDDEFWTPRKVATRLRKSESRIRGLCDEGSLPML
jgi:hypothetical protein